jgi:hypothetical protein
MSALYEADFVAWLTEQAGRLREARPNVIDWENVAEELEGMGRAERHAVASQLCRLMAHMLKWRYQPKRRGRSWRLSILDSRDRIERLLEDSPSLRNELPDMVAVEWPRAVRWAGNETGIDRGAFPADCPWSLDEMLDADFLP